MPYPVLMKPAHRVVLRLMLLVVLSLGVVAMHTLGHLDGHDMSSPATHLSMQATPSGVGVGAAEAPDDSAMAGWMCLAIVGVGVALLFVRLRSRSARDALAQAGSRMLSWSRSLRGPPFASLTRTVVLRI